MKKIKQISILLVFAGTIFSSTKAQLPIDPETNKVVFTDVIQLDGMTKDEINKKAKTWIVTTLKSGDNMVELSGTNADQVVGTGNLNLSNENIIMGIDEVLNFKFIVKCKDGKAKYSVENFNLSFFYSIPHSTSLENIEPILELKKDGTKRSPDAEREVQIKVAVKKNIDILIASFVSYMKNTEEEW